MADTTPKQGSLGLSVLNLLRTLKSELIQTHFLPLKQHYDDSLRNIPRTEPNPAMYIGRQTGRYHDSRESCRKQVAALLREQIDSLASEAAAEIDSWPTTTDIYTTVERVESICDGFGRSEYAASAVNGNTDVCLSSTVRSSGVHRYQATVEDAPESEHEDKALVAPTSPQPKASEPIIVCDLTNNPTIDSSPTPVPVRAPQLEESKDGDIRILRTESRKHRLAQQSGGKSAPAHAPVDRGAPSPESLKVGTKRSAATMKDSIGSSRLLSAKRPKDAPAAGPEVSITMPEPCLTTKNVITMANVHDDECIHRFGQHEGLYVLRCSLATCKKRLADIEGASRQTNSSRALGKMTVYFTASPLDRDRALNHFKGRGHNVRNIRDIYSRYAIRVTDAAMDRHLGDPADKRPCLRLGSAHGSKSYMEETLSARAAIAQAFWNSTAAPHLFGAQGSFGISSDHRRSANDGTGARPAAGAGLPKSRSHKAGESLRNVQAGGLVVTNSGPIAISDDEE
ncbi:hypothetical protein Micbo1qcDRAFT_221822 [Microdochium bolleyi]|uniref:Uncharacterized protein n=1 Tax=Microdochium bolleyi TaxID=196109 RepID=A0A136IL20_9PEZI|nr:hypothetical protein Micbo1qcDRAFT_221822 [Microdochium bolleyi]